MMKKIVIACCICLVLSAIRPLAAQYVGIGVEGQIPMSKLGEMEDMLGVADAGQKVDLLTRLGIDPEIGKMVAGELLPGQKIELQPIRVHQETHYGIAFLPSFRCSYLYLLQGADDDPKKMPWHVIDKQELDCWHESCVLEFLALRRAESDDIVVHHANCGHGSNYAQDQTRIFSILGGKLVQTMAAQDYLWQEILGSVIEHREEHKSTFLRFPDLSLEETRTTTVNDELKKVERRYWHWSEQKHRFVSSRFMLAVAPNS